MEIKHIRPPLLVFGLIVLAAALLIMVRQTFNREVPSVEVPAQQQSESPFTLSSSAFLDGADIPDVYTCKGANLSPPLSIENPPTNAKEFVLIVHDPDAPSKDWVHWLVWDIPSNTTIINENSVPPGSTQGTNDFGTTLYGGPCPPKGSGTHHYNFELYALNDVISLPPTTTRDGVIAAMNGKVISKAQLVGTVVAE